MKIVSGLKKIVMRSTALRKTARKVVFSLKNVRYRANGLTAKVDDKLIVFAAYNGKNYACSPKSVYEFMAGNDVFRDYKFVWFFDKPEEYRFLEKNRNTKVAAIGSKECEKYLHQAKYWIFNFRAQDHWIPSDEQIYVQCWHGTPLKRLGYDITNSDNAMNSVSEIRDKYKTDTKRINYLLSSCKFVTEKFTSAWNLKEFNKEDIILEVGYPRNDFLVNHTEADALAVKKSLGLKDDKKIILYAPTWRDNQHDADKGYVYDNPVDFEYLREKLSDEYVILFRAHYLVADNFDFKPFEGFVYNVSDYDDINGLYVIADLLITDYSSVFFDYAILERPMIFYMYDMDEYRDEMRGFYLDVASLPGPIVKSEAELVNAIDSLSDSSEETRSQICEFNQVYNNMNDGKAAERLVERVLI